MNIEVVDFYQQSNSGTAHRPHTNFIGTLHIYICDLDIDLRGLPVFKKGKRIFIQMPTKMGIDPDTKEQVKYPTFNFANHNKQKEFVSAIVKVGVPFIQKKYDPPKKAASGAPFRTLRRIPTAR